MIDLMNGKRPVSARDERIFEAMLPKFLTFL